MLFYCLLNIMAFGISAVGIFPSVGVTLPWQTDSNGNLQVASLFNIDLFSALTGIFGGIAIGIVGFLLKQGVYASFAVVIFVFGVVFKPISLMFTSLPQALGALAGPSGGFLVTMILSIVSLAGFWFMVELLMQRYFS